VTVCNVDHIPDTAIEHAENQAVYVFRAADVEIHWMSCGVELPTPDARMRPGFIVRVLAGGPFAKADPVSLDPIGRAFMNASGFGFLADAYYGAIRDVKSLYPGVASDQLLGYTIVHELGHLLIGPGHRPNGIMRAAWSRKEVVALSRGLLQFDDAERAAILRTLRSRAAGSDATAGNGSHHEWWFRRSGRQQTTDGKCLRHAASGRRWSSGVDRRGLPGSQRRCRILSNRVE
jgi:hypothetical protein